MLKDKRFEGIGRFCGTPTQHRLYSAVDSFEHVKHAENDTRMEQMMV